MRKGKPAKPFIRFVIKSDTIRINGIGPAYGVSVSGETEGNHWRLDCTTLLLGPIHCDPMSAISSVSVKSKVVGRAEGKSDRSRWEPAFPSMDPLFGQTTYAASSSFSP